MARPSVLEMDQIVAAMTKLHPDWDVASGALHREIAFADFNEAFAFMTEIAQVAEQLDHHPEWCNVYNRVVIDLVTHDPRGITQLDLDLAIAVDVASDRYQASS